MLYARNYRGRRADADDARVPRLPGAYRQNIAITSDIACSSPRGHHPDGDARENLREAVSTLAPHLKQATPVIACAKGIERGTHRFMTEVIAEATPDATPAILSGPILPTTWRAGADRRHAGCQGRKLAALWCRRWARRLPALSHHGYSRRRDRRRGKERAGDRSRHRGRTQARRFGAGRADHARLQRTRAARPGLRRARRNVGGIFRPRRSDPELLQSAIAQFCARHRARPRRAPNRDKLAEGEFTAPVLIELAASQNVDMPVSNAVAAILSGKVTIDAAIEGLLTRPFKAEE